MRSRDCSSPIYTYQKHETNPGAVIPTAHVQQSSSRQGGVEMNNKRHCVVGGIGAYDIYGNYCVYYILDIVCGWSQLCSPAARQWSGRRAAAALLLVTCVPGPRSYWPPVLPRCVHVRGAGCQHAQLHTARAAHGPRVVPRAGSLWGAWCWWPYLSRAARSLDPATGRYWRKKTKMFKRIKHISCCLGINLRLLY